VEIVWKVKYSEHRRRRLRCPSATRRLSQKDGLRSLPVAPRGAP
jgi:hypothetical protein